jgi:hypothetical protein
LRRHLTVWSVAWLLSQLASVVAFVPIAALAADAECLPSTPGDRCPMREANGNPCPMHQSEAASSHSHDAAKEAECRLVALSGGPAAALAALFSVPGVLSDAAIVTSMTVSRLAAATVPALHYRALTHDPPPPRA